MLSSASRMPDHKATAIVQGLRLLFHTIQLADLVQLSVCLAALAFGLHFLGWTKTWGP